MITGEAIIWDEILADLDSGKYEIVREVQGLGYTHIKMCDDCTNQVIQRMADMSCGYLIWCLIDGEPVYYQPGGGGTMRYQVEEK